MQLVQNLSTSRTVKRTGRIARPLSSYDDANLRALRKIPEIRAYEVARARALVKDPSYPSPEILRRVAQLLAEKLT